MKGEAEFAVFCIENLALKTSMAPQAVYELLAEKTDILTNYIIPFCDVLHTRSKRIYNGGSAGGPA